MELRKRAVVAVLVPGLALGLAACGGGSATDKKTDGLPEGRGAPLAGRPDALAALDTAGAERDLGDLLDRGLARRPQPGGARSRRTRWCSTSACSSAARAPCAGSAPCRRGSSWPAATRSSPARTSRRASGEWRRSWSSSATAAGFDTLDPLTGAGGLLSTGPGTAEHGRPRAQRGSRVGARSTYRLGMPLAAGFLAALERSLPPEALIREPGQLRTYECDALTGHRVGAGARRDPGHGRAGAAGGARSATSTASRSSPAAPAPGSRAARCRSPSGIVISLARLNRVLEVDLEHGRVVVEPGVTNLEITQRGRRRRLLLRARPVEPAGVHDRRQRRRELGRRALPQARLHRQPRARRRRRAPRRRARHALARRRGARPARRLRRLRGHARDRRARSRCASCGRPRRCARCSPASRRPTSPGEAVSQRRSRRGILPAAIEMMDALALEAVEAAVQAGYPGGAGAVLIVELDGPAAQVAEESAAVEALCREYGAVRPPRGGDGRRARPRLARPEVGVRGHGPDRVELLRAGRRRPAHAAARGAPADGRALGRVRPAGRRASSTPATATCTRSCSTTSRFRARPSAPSSWRRRSSTPASTPAARSPASTASASTRPARCRSSSASATSRRCSSCARASIPDGLANPGKVFPTPAPLRRGAGPLPRAPAGAGRPCRASLSPRRSRRPRSCSPPARRSRSTATAARSASRPRGLDRVLEHEPGDLTAIVEAGIRLSELQEHLAAHGQMLALDPPGDPTDRRVPRRRSLRPAPPPLRRDARPRDRRHASCCRAGSSRARAARS